MKIERILIQNFKNIRSTLILNFQKDVTLFVGPNGFGKTTIFDAIELSLTGDIRRVSEANYSDGRSAFEVPYFQHNSEEDTIIRIELINEEKQSLVITSFYDKDQNNTRNNTPKQSLVKFKRFLELNSEYPFEDLHNFKKSDALDESEVQERIRLFLGCTSQDYILKNTFDLFNYVQQDESDYYLRKKEKDRKECLNFLMNIDSYFEKKKNLEDIKRLFADAKKKLISKKESIKEFSIESPVKYKKLPLRIDGDFLFNNEEIPFRNEVLEINLQNYLQEVDDFHDFLLEFSPKDFFLKRQSLRFEADILRNKDFLKYIVFENIIWDKKAFDDINKVYSLFSEEKNYIAFILKEYIPLIRVLEDEQKMLKDSEELKQLLSVEFQQINFDLIKLKVLEFYNWTFGKEWLKRFESVFNNFKSNYSQLSHNQQEINTIIQLRKELEKHNHNKESTCIYCGYNWQQRENLISAYDRMTEVITNNLSIFEKIVKTELDELTELKESLFEQIKIEQNKTKYISKELLDEIRSCVNYDLPIEFEKLIEEKTDILPLNFSEEINWTEYLRIKETLIELMRKQFLIPYEYYKDITRIEKKKEEFRKLKKEYSVINGPSIQQYQLSIELFPLSLEVIEQRLQALMSFLNKLKLRFDFDEKKSEDRFNLFEKYFNFNEDLFNACSTQDIRQKREYIIYQYKQNCLGLMKKIEERIKLLDSYLPYLGQRINELNDNIKFYQENLIQQLKLPFYLYSAKILQNYQQGMGVLLTTQNNTNIRLLANSESSQDIMYQLSSGQIAVISFVFTLALNTTFKISKEFKLLAVDDPIQDMDAMNVYALIDLMRHSFSDYQIIMSTHSDSSAMFIKYKFDLFSDESDEKVGIENIKSILLDDSDLFV